MSVLLHFPETYHLSQQHLCNCNVFIMFCFLQWLRKKVVLDDVMNSSTTLEENFHHLTMTMTGSFTQRSGMGLYNWKEKEKGAWSD